MRAVRIIKIEQFLTPLTGLVQHICHVGRVAISNLAAKLGEFVC